MKIKCIDSGQWKHIFYEGKIYEVSEKRLPAASLIHYKDFLRHGRGKTPLEKWMEWADRVAGMKFIMVENIVRRF